jgi:septal ring factor EnvC (AmiA/AmiB activator)
VFSDELIQDKEAKMSDNVLLAVMALIVGFVLVWLIAWLAWQRQVSEHEEHLRSLQTLLKGKEVSLLALRVRLQEREANVERLRGQVSQSEPTIPDLTAHTEEWNQAIGRLESAESERGSQIEGLRAHV